MDDYDDLTQKALVSVKTISYDSKNHNNLQDVPVLKIKKGDIILGMIVYYDIIEPKRILNISMVDTTYAIKLPEGENQKKILPILINYHLTGESDSEILYITKENFSENDKLNLRILVFVNQQD